MTSKRSHPTVQNGLLPPAYRFTTDHTTALAHFETVDWALHHLPGVYWGKERSSEKLRRQVENGRAVMVLRRKACSEESGREWIPREGEASVEEEDLIGYMRIVTDEEDFGYLDDLFILDGHCGLGLAKLLMYEAVNNTGGYGNSKDWHWFLWTKNAHDFHEGFGFRKCPTNGWAMDREGDPEKGEIGVAAVPSTL